MTKNKADIAEKPIQRLQIALDQYDQIVFFEEEAFLAECCSPDVFRAVRKRILILSKSVFREEAEYITFRQITEEEARQLTELYFLYDFSDKFLYISRKNTNYASLRHFVETGLLSMKEAMEALFH